MVLHLQLSSVYVVGQCPSGQVLGLCGRGASAQMGEEEASLSGWKSILNRGNSECKGPEVQVCLECERKSKEASVTGPQWLRRKNRPEGLRGGNNGGLWRNVATML